jgi:hypothetical protein
MLSGMGRDESSREHLLREATAFVERIELIRNGAICDGHIIVGFRRDGALSIFFGEDPVYQFNAEGELRRAYRDGKLLKAVHGRLVALQRVRTEQEVQLVGHELSKAEEAAFLSQLSEQVRKFAALLRANAFEVAGQVPEDSNVLARLQAWLLAHDRWQIAAQPNA